MLSKITHFVTTIEETLVEGLIRLFRGTTCENSMGF